MAKMYGLARIGRNVELRKAPNGDPVAGLALAFAYGKRGADGKKQTLWVDANLWGKRAESLAPYLTKGSQVVAHLDDVHIQTFDGRNGPSAKLVGRIADLELVAGQQEKATADESDTPF